METSKVACLMIGFLSSTSMAADQVSCETVKSVIISAESARELNGHENFKFHTEMVQVDFDLLGHICGVTDIATVDADSQPNF